MDQHKKSISLAILKKFHFFSDQLFFGQLADWQISRRAKFDKNLPENYRRIVPIVSSYKDKFSCLAISDQLSNFQKILTGAIRELEARNLKVNATSVNHTSGPLSRPTSLVIAKARDHLDKT